MKMSMPNMPPDGMRAAMFMGGAKAKAAKRKKRKKKGKGKKCG